MDISGATRLLGLIGDPVSHSLSPLMHNAALAELGLDYVYVPFPAKAERLSIVVGGLHAIGVQGFNVTIPHKQAVVPLLQMVSPQAQAIGAVNTVYRLEDPHYGWGGTNTDLDGFLYPLRQLNQDWRSVTATILGSGGAARAVIQGCIELGIVTIQVVGRSPHALAQLQQTWPSLVLVDWTHLTSTLPTTHLLVNTTPIGMKKTATDPSSPISVEDLQRLPSKSIVYDLIYTPNPTELLKVATALGHHSIDGLEMLIQQGAKALSLWTGEEQMQVETMLRAARAQLFG